MEDAPPETVRNMGSVLVPSVPWWLPWQGRPAGRAPEEQQLPHPGNPWGGASKYCAFAGLPQESCGAGIWPLFGERWKGAGKREEEGGGKQMKTSLKIAEPKCGFPRHCKYNKEHTWHLLTGCFRHVPSLSFQKVLIMPRLRVLFWGTYTVSGAVGLLVFSSAFWRITSEGRTYGEELWVW